MSASPVRVLLAVDGFQRAAALSAHLRAAGHDEIIVVEARGDAALKAARLLHPDLLVLNGPLRGSLDGVALATALQDGQSPSVPVVMVTNPEELPGLLALHTQSQLGTSALEAPRPADAALDAALEEAES